MTSVASQSDWLVGDAVSGLLAILRSTAAILSSGCLRLVCRRE